MQGGWTLEGPEVADLPPRPFVCLEAHGAFDKNARPSWQRFHREVLPHLPLAQGTGMWAGCLVDESKSGDEKWTYLPGVCFGEAPEIPSVAVQAGAQSRQLGDSQQFAKFVMKGPFQHLREAWGQAFEKLAAQGHKLRCAFAFEEYVGMLKSKDCSNPVTNIWIPLQSAAETFHLSGPILSKLPPRPFICLEVHGEFSKSAPASWERFEKEVKPHLPMEKATGRWAGNLLDESKNGDEKYTYQPGFSFDKAPELVEQARATGAMIKQVGGLDDYAQYRMEGGFENLGIAWGAAFSKLGPAGLRPRCGMAFEEYVDMTATTPVTEIWIPVEKCRAHPD
mmetsp:Transcript_59752/g.134827  ORF Transcript_59752/g.134827 Transcript_59752/m.134827 type:complete len:337 (-) Transcript_59752:192-1202(-)